MIIPIYLRGREHVTVEKENNCWTYLSRVALKTPLLCHCFWGLIISTNWTAAKENDVKRLKVRPCQFDKTVNPRITPWGLINLGSFRGVHSRRGLHERAYKSHFYVAMQVARMVAVSQFLCEIARGIIQVGDT